jgi:hypothetical protein
MLALDVGSLIVTVCAPVYVPEGGLKVGAAAWGRLRAYVALAVARLASEPTFSKAIPSHTVKSETRMPAKAVMVSDDETVIGPE